MSDRPRFYVREHAGYWIGEQFAGRWRVEVMVLDRDRCHEVVRRWGHEKHDVERIRFYRSGSECWESGLEARRRVARDLCFELNLWNESELAA